MVLGLTQILPGHQWREVTMVDLDAKTLYDIWCYAEDDNVYPQIPNGQKFTAAEVETISTLDTTPPILTIVSAESPTSSDIRIKVKLDEPGTVWCNSFQTGTAYQPVAPAAGDWFNLVRGTKRHAPHRALRLRSTWVRVQLGCSRNGTVTWQGKCYTHHGKVNGCYPGYLKVLHQGNNG
eukprot:Skav208745  [mRNA]  locus=scaffold742:450518:463818:- [translate_table: standard]